MEVYLNKLVNGILIQVLGIGDWGLGIGPNPQSPIPVHEALAYDEY